MYQSYISHISVLYQSYISHISVLLLVKLVSADPPDGPGRPKSLKSPYSSGKTINFGEGKQIVFFSLGQTVLEFFFEEFVTPGAEI